MLQPGRGFKPWQPAAVTAIWLLYGNYQSVFSRVPHSGRPLQDGRGLRASSQHLWTSLVFICLLIVGTGTKADVTAPLNLL